MIFLIIQFPTLRTVLETPPPPKSMLQDSREQVEYFAYHAEHIHEPTSGPNHQKRVECGSDEGYRLAAALQVQHERRHYHVDLL